MFITRTIQTEQRDHPRFDVWLQRNLQPFSIVALLACLRLDNFALLQSTGIGRRLFASPPPMSVAVVNRSKAFGIVSTLCGDCPQLIISAFFLLHVDDAWSAVDIISLCQVIISTASLLHQLILRAFAFMLVSSPNVEQQWLDQTSEMGQLLDCMVAEDFQRRRSRRDRSNKLAAVLPLVVDPQCLDVHFSTDRVPAKVMEQYAEIMKADQFAHRMEPPRIGTLLTGLTQSADAIKLWSSGGIPIDTSNQCDFAAQAVALYLDRQAESASTYSDGNDDGGEFWRQRQRRDRHRSGIGSELELQGLQQGTMYRS
jgi:hypothetical protein